MKKFSGFVMRHRLPVIVAFLAVTAFFAVWIPRLTVNSDLVSYMPREDPAVSLLRHLGERFNQDDLVLAALESPDVFSPESLAEIARLTRAFQAVDGVTGVMSLSAMLDIRPAADGGIDVGMLVDPDALPSSDRQASELRAYVLGKERYRSSIVSADGRAALLICRTRPGSDPVALIRSLQSAAARVGITGTLHFGGNPVLISELGSVILHDFRILIPIVIVLIVVTLLLTFGTIRGVLIPLASVTMSVIWLVGFMGLTRIPLTLISDIIPALLMALGTAPCIHLLSKFDEDVTRYGGQGDDTRSALGEVGIRIVLAALTIILGFSSFVVGSYLTTIRDFGILASIGVAFSLLISVMFVPALLASIKVSPRSRVRLPGSGILRRAMTNWAGFVVRRRTAILVAGGALLVAAAAAIPFIARESDFAYFLEPGNPVRRTEAILQKQFGGSRTLQVDFRGDLSSPFVLQQMARFEMFMSGEGLARNVVSVADLLAEMNGIVEGVRAVPDDAGKVANLMFLLEGQDIVNGLITADSREGQIQGMVGMLDTHELQRTVTLLDRQIAGMARTLFILDVAGLDHADLQVVGRIRAARAAEELQWLARKRTAGAVLDLPAVSAAIAGQLLESGRITEAPAAVSAILALAPKAVRADEGFVEDVRGEVAGLQAARVALSQSECSSLSASARAAASRETVQFEVSYTGMPLIGWHLDQSVLWSQAESLAFTLVFIFALLAIKLRSWRAGLMGLAPIGLAIMVMFGLMGAARIPVNVATVLVGCIALGIGIDYSIHFSVRFTTYYQGSASPEEAVTRTLQTTGQAIVINVLAVTMGFVALLFAQLLPLRQFGLLTATAMIGSGLGALTLLPALILIAPSAFARRDRSALGGPRRKWRQT
jgi:predicted RND superfamily exporter protein